MNVKCGILFFVACLVLFGQSRGVAATVELKIEVTNPRSTPQTRDVRSNLPVGVGTNAIISLDGMELDYDVQDDIYQVYREVELDPKETRTFRVEIRDIWTIPEPELGELKSHADKLLQSLKGTKFVETGKQLYESVVGKLEKIIEEQEENSIAAGARPVIHIAAYESNLEKLDEVKKDLARLENLVLGAGKDPGRIVEPGRGGRGKERTSAPSLEPEEYNTGVIEVTVRNTSPNRTREIELRHPLPQEIGVNDVLDADGLQVLPDFKRGIAYLTADDLELKPEESRTYRVKIRDKWNVNQRRIEDLGERVKTVRDRIAAQESFEAIETALTGIEEGLAEIRAQEGPQEINEEYAQFYRAQSEKVGLLERKLERIEDALRPATSGSKLGFDVKPPSMKSTWLIIYAILGFLAVMSMLFFLRWFSKSQAERVFERMGPKGGEGEVGKGSGEGAEERE